MDANWAQVILTAIYVGATIAIFVANNRSAKASEEQTREMKKEFEEANRPIVEVEFLYINRTFFGLRFVNHGKRTAQQVKISLSEDFVNSIKEHKFRVLLEKQKGKECIIGVNQHYDIFFGTNEYRNNTQKPPASGSVCYSNNGTQYEEAFFVDTENYATWYSVESETEKELKQLENIRDEIKGLRKSIVNIRVAHDNNNQGDCSSAMSGDEKNDF